MSDRFVAHFDILGWKYAVERDFETAWRVFQNYADGLERLNRLKMEVEGVVRPARAHSRLFSDTIILATPGDDDLDLYDLLIRCGELLKNSLNGFLAVRGGVALGSFQEDLPRNLFAGLALNRAYAIGEEAQWFGVVLDEPVALRASGLSPQFASDALDPGIVCWDVPLKNGATVHRPVLNWPPIYRDNFIKSVALTGQALLRFVHPIFGPWAALPQDVRAKYDHTARFIVTQLRDHQRRQRGDL